MNQSLKDKFALVTGASSGIGKAVALHLAELGASVTISARRDEKLADLVKTIQSVGGQAQAVKSDAGNTGQIDDLFAKCLSWGRRLDAVVVNAGRGLAGGVLNSDENAWEEIYRLNVLGAAHLMRISAQHMVEQKGGDIVVLGSVSGHNISPYSGFYGSSKWAITAAAESLRREVCSHGVRVSTIMPGVVQSEFQEVAGYNFENFSKSAQRFGKCLEPADVARAIGFIITQPAHVHINELVIRPTGEDYP
ncbi:MAG TPA: SDR family oxidoreductase [Phycisphaerae bacterium]|nr:SDR family oxidoreductase [Phycisphaerae bacterium]